MTFQELAEYSGEVFSGQLRYRENLRRKTYEYLSKVREPSATEQETLRGRGFIFLPVEAKPLVQVVSENKNHFESGELDYINGITYPDLRTYVPPEMIVAFKPTQLFIPNSSVFSDVATQLRETGRYFQDNPEIVLLDAKALILPSSIFAQADIVYFRRTGKLLFENCFVRALDHISKSGFAAVGRRSPAERLRVHYQRSGRYGGRIQVPLAIVFLQT